MQFRFSSIVLTTICFLLLATFPGWHYEHDDLTGSDIDVKPFPAKSSVAVILSCSFMATMLTLVASLWQHTAAVAVASVIGSIGHESLNTSIGAAAMAMSWAAFGILSTITIMMWVMRESMRVLDQVSGD